MLRGILDNVLSGMKAGFKAILNLEHPFARRKMDTQKGSSKLSATLLALILGASVFMAGQVWAAKYVTDPATGETWTTPEYGGTLTWAAKVYPPGIDPWFKTGWAQHLIGGVNERLAFADWGLSREIWHGELYQVVTPEMTRGSLAASWSMPDDTTFIFNIRQGVHWDNKAPVNGREFDAYDVEWNYHRFLGLGDFTEDGPSAGKGGVTMGAEIVSVTATDKWTVEIKLAKPTLDVLGKMLNNYFIVLPREVIEKYGDAKDWRNVVGTGPLRLTDFVEGSSATWVKNPNYWGVDEKFGNRLPYIDEYRSLLMPDMSTRLAALRAGKIDMMSNVGDAYITSIDDAMSLQRSNPEMEFWPIFSRPSGTFYFNQSLPLMQDVNVRKALQMSVDRETINASYNKGLGDPTPYGLVGQFTPEYSWPYENWPDEVKHEYEYHPEEAEALLDAAGYPRGADGVRFKIGLGHFDRWDATYPELLIGYFDAIGVKGELEVLGTAEMGAALKAESFEYGLFTGYYGYFGGPGLVGATFGAVTKLLGNPGPSKMNDPRMDALYLAAKETTEIEEFKRIQRQADELCVRVHCGLVKSNTPNHFVNQPWVQGYFGEAGMGWGERMTHLARIWIDQELKKAKGH